MAEFDHGDKDPPAEPAVRAPWPVLSLALALVALYFLQSSAANPGAVAVRYGFSPAAMEEGDRSGIVTALFVHGGWAHVLLNALGLLAFGAPVGRLLSGRLGGALVFLGFFVICGVIANLGFAALHPGLGAVLIGASGAVAGLMGAASRLIERRDVLAPFTSRAVVGMASAWLIVNLLIAVVGFEAVSGGAPIAWEAHLVGYAAGLLLIGPALRLFGARALTRL